MRIAVCIPALNVEKYIRSSLVSIICGNRKPDELLVMDGGSTDATVEIASELGARIVQNPKKHAASARQLALESTNCDIVAFTDADCRVEQNWLKIIEERFIEDASLDGVGGRIIFDSPGNIVQKYASETFHAIMNFPTGPLLVKQKQMQGSFPECNCAFKRSAVIEVGGYSDFFLIMRKALIFSGACSI